MLIASSTSTIKCYRKKCPSPSQTICQDIFRSRVELQLIMQGALYRKLMTSRSIIPSKILETNSIALSEMFWRIHSEVSQSKLLRSTFSVAT